MENIELKAYRHKTDKGLYITRSGYGLGSERTRYYEVTRNILEAIRSYNCYKDDFMNCYHAYPGTTAIYQVSKEMNFDGYIGILSKTIEVPISEFELVEFKEDEQ